MPDFNINRFRNYGLTDGGARPCLFEVNFPNIPGATGQGGGTNNTELQRLSQLCQAASLPASEIDQVEVPYQGRRVKFSAERVFADWRVAVINDEDFSARDMFEAWSNSINMLVDNITQDADLTAYKLDGVEVFQFGKGGDIIRSYMFFGMWPKSVGDIQLNWGQTNQIEVFEVTFAVDFWIPTIADGASNFIGYKASNGDLGSVGGGVPPQRLVAT
jgi:hypothetical protein